MENLDKMDALKSKQFFDVDNVTIVATFDRLLKTRVVDKKDKNSAIFKDIRTVSGKPISDIGVCHFGMVMQNLRPCYGDRFILKNCSNAYGTMGEHIRFAFPKEIIGENNKKHLKYNYSAKRLEAVIENKNDPKTDLTES